MTAEAEEAEFGTLNVNRAKLSAWLTCDSIRKKKFLSPDGVSVF